MPTNDFLVWDPNSVNIELQATYAADTARLNGVSSGTASSSLANKVWRQASSIASMIAQFIANQSGANSVDDGTTATLLTNFTAAVLGTGKNIAVYKINGGVQQVAINGAAFTATGATSFPPPASGYAYGRMWGAGGGSGGSGTGTSVIGGPGGGGEYAEGIFSGLTTSTTVTVGAPGTAGSATPGNGGNGGTTSFGTLMTAVGGSGGGAQAGTGSALPGTGGTGGTGGTFRVAGFSGNQGFVVGSNNLTGAAGGTFGTSNGSQAIGGDTIAITAPTALFPGGGGGGCANGGAASTGASGCVIVIY